MNEGKRGRPPTGDAPVKAQIVQLFEKEPDREWSVIDVIDVLKERDPSINESSARWTISTVKRNDLIHRVRNEGHHHIYKFGPDPRAISKPNEKSALSSSPNDQQGDLAVLEEAKAVIEKLQALVQRNQNLVQQIEHFRSVLHPAEALR